MRASLVAALVIFAAFVPLASGATKAERIGRIRDYVHEQKQDLSDARSRLNWTWDELQSANEQIAAVAKERDGWKSYGDEIYRRWMNDEVELAKYRKHGFFTGLLKVVGLVGSFITNPFAFIVSRALQVIFGLAVAVVLFLVARHVFRRIRQSRQDRPDHPYLFQKP